MPPTVPVKDQSLSTGQHPTAKADLSPTKRREAVIRGKTWTGETLRQESWEGLGGKFAGWTTEAWITSRRWKETVKTRKQMQLMTIQ